MLWNFFLYRGDHLGYVFLLLGTLVLFLVKFASRSLSPIYKVRMAVAMVIGWFVSSIILILIFYLVFTPIGILLKILGKDLLDEKWDEKKVSYWIKKEKKGFDKKRYEKLY